MGSFLKGVFVLMVGLGLIWFGLTWRSDQGAEQAGVKAFEQRLSQGGATLVSSSASTGTNYGLPAVRILYTARCGDGREFQGEAIGSWRGRDKPVRYEWEMDVTPEQIC